MTISNLVYRFVAGSAMILCLSCQAQNAQTSTINKANTDAEVAESTDEHNQPVAYNINTGEMQPENLQPKEKVINLNTGQATIIKVDVTDNLAQSLQNNERATMRHPDYPNYGAGLITALESETNASEKVAVVIEPIENLNDVERKYLQSSLDSINIQTIDNKELWYATADHKTLKQLAISELITTANLQPQLTIPTPPSVSEPDNSTSGSATNDTQATDTIAQANTSQPASNSATSTVSQSLDLLKQLSASAPTKDIAFSTYSLDQAAKAAMLAMPKPLAAKRPSWLLPELTTQTLTAIETPLLPSYQNHNQLFYRQGDTVSPDFTSQYKRLLNGKTEALDFSDPQAAAKQANDWVSQQTAGMINNVLKPEAFEQNDAILSNVLYFKANWQSPFDAKKTKPMPFTDATGETKPVPTMAQTFEVYHAQQDGWEYVGIPFADGSMLQLFLTPDGKTTAVPSEAMVMTLLKDSQLRKVDLMLPKLDLAGDTLILNDIAPEIDSWQLPNLIENKVLKNPKMIHKSIITWDEVGAEAAAFSAVMASKSIALPPKVHVNRPFVFMIRQGSDVMFTGAVRELEAVE